MNTLLRAAVAAVALALLLAACGEAAEETAPEPEAEEPEAAEEPEEADEPEEPEEPEEADDAAAVTVAVGSTDLGDVLVDGDGMTLYLFEADAQGESTCYDDCEANWPPLIVDGDAAAGDGADDGLLGTTEREDGSTQVTYDGWPLYYWVGDDAPGDTDGQGVGDVWWVVAPDGSPVSEAEDDTATRDGY